MVLLGLSLPFIGSIYFFGWISACIVGLSMVTCVLTEWMFIRRRKGKISEAVLVTGALLGMILPPTIPLYMVILGGIFAITFGKMAFGGFGVNIFNPAMVGRIFLYLTFPVHMTNRWIPAADFSEFPGGFGVWRFSPLKHYADAITSATASHAYRSGAASLPGVFKMLSGNINGHFEHLGEMMRIGGGSRGETSALLIVIGGMLLIIKKTASWRIVISFFLTYIITNSIFHLFVPELTPNALYSIASGGAVLGGFFMVTDPVSAPKMRTAHYIYGGFIALMTNLIRTFSMFAGGLMFAILLGNMFGPLMDHAVKHWRKKGDSV